MLNHTENETAGCEQCSISALLLITHLSFHLQRLWCKVCRFYEYHLRGGHISESPSWRVNDQNGQNAEMQINSKDFQPHSCFYWIKMTVAGFCLRSRLLINDYMSSWERKEEINWECTSSKASIGNRLLNPAHTHWCVSAGVGHRRCSQSLPPPMGEAGAPERHEICSLTL